MISQGNTGQVNASTKNPGSYQNNQWKWLFEMDFYPSDNNVLDILKIFLHDLKLKEEIDVSISHELFHWWVKRLTLG